MMLDRLFWVWFAITAIVFVYMLFIETSPYWFVFPLLLIGMGLDRLSDDKRDMEHPRTDEKLLEKLKGKK